MCSSAASLHLPMFALLKEMIDAHISNSRQHPAWESRKTDSAAPAGSYNSGPSIEPVHVPPPFGINTDIHIPVPSISSSEDYPRRNSYDNSMGCEKK